MTLVTIKCSKCGNELVSIEQEGDVSILALDPCPTCLSAEYEAGLDDEDDDWSDLEEDDDSWTEDDDDWDEEEDEEEEDN